MIHPDMIGVGKKYRVLILDYDTVELVTILHVQDGMMEVKDKNGNNILINLEHVSAMEEANESVGPSK